MNKNKLVEWAGMGAIVAFVLTVVVGVLVTGRGDSPETAMDEATPIAKGSDTVESTPTPTPTPSKTKATPTPTPTKTKEAADTVSWVNIALLSRLNDETFNDEYKSPLFRAKTGKLRIEWDMDPIIDEYNWTIVVFREGQTPDNSVGVSPLLMSDATYGTGTADSGKKSFKVTAGKRYYLWMAIWHVDAMVAVDEAR